MSIQLIQLNRPIDSKYTFLGAGADGAAGAVFCDSRCQNVILHHSLGI